MLKWAHSTEEGAQLISDLCSSGDEEPFRVVDLRLVKHQCQLWRSHLPAVRPFYAVKCFPDSQIVRTIGSDSDFGFDCCSLEELKMVLGAGIAPDRIIYAHPCKPVSFLAFARDSNVSLLTFDNEEEVAKIALHHPRARLVLRLCVRDGASAFPLQNKFGADLRNAPALLALAKDKGLNVVGVSFHVGCDATDPHAFSSAMQDALAVLAQASEICGRDMEILDIGGGYPGREMGLFAKIAADIKSVSVPAHISTIAEPGRFFVGTCMSVYASIFGKRVVNGVVHYHINDGFYGNLGVDPVRFMVPIPVPRRKYSGSEALDVALPDETAETAESAESARLGWRESKIWGPTCDSLDILVQSCRLPDLQIGDKICFKQVGAYTAPLVTNFCGFRNERTFYLE